MQEQARVQHCMMVLASEVRLMENMTTMALLDIVLEGNPILRQKAHRIRHVDDSIRQLAHDMFETMLEAPGVGLAAPQVGKSIRLLVAHLPAGFDDEDDPEYSFALVNPEIVKQRGRVVGPEGCLSIPGWQGDVPRAEQITVKAMTLDNREVRLKLEGYIARVLQHEIDHLDGILYTDRVEDKTTIRPVEEPIAADSEVEEAVVGATEPVAERR
jgi:peptide deformylase